MIRLAKQIVAHPTTEQHLEICAESIGLINQWTQVFLDADAIAGAQFYYTNPLMFIPIAGETERHAPLYGNHLYLLNVEDWGSVTPTHPVFATNQNFIEQIGPITDFSDHNPDKLLEYHLEHGLYLIGIHQKQDRCTSDLPQELPKDVKRLWQSV